MNIQEEEDSHPTFKNWRDEDETQKKIQSLAPKFQIQASKPSKCWAPNLPLSFSFFDLVEWRFN